MSDPSAIAGVVEEVPDEPFRFRVQSSKTDEKYLVDIQSFGFTGECNCPHNQVRLAPKIATGKRGPEFRCKHLRLAREYFLENILPKLAMAMGMEEPEIDMSPVASTEYGKARNVFLNKHRKCAVFPALDATECHHAFGRLGLLLLEERLWIPVSRLGHNWIGDHKNEARQKTWNGVPLLAPLGEWNNPRKERLK